MPTGYTAEVADGKVTDFRTFALRCARQFGATIMQRDDPMNEPPKRREVAEYYVTRVENAKARALEVATMTLERATAEADQAYEAEVASRAKYATVRTETRNRYNAMLSEVMGWTAPTPDHEAMKQFMIDQLVESRKFDCTDYEQAAPRRLTGEQWLARARRLADEDSDDAAKALGEERARCAKANAWIDALYESLNAPLVAR